MSISTEALEALVAAGATPEMILAAIKADRAKDEEKAAIRRAKNAERQRRHRERNALSRVTDRDERVTACDTPLPKDAPTLSGNVEVTQSPLPSQKTPPKGGSKKGSRLPTDWQPTELDRAYAQAKGVAGAWLDREVEKFRNYWTAKPGEGGCKLDWAATWRNWVISAADRGGPSVHSPILSELDERRRRSAEAIRRLSANG